MKVSQAGAVVVLATCLAGCDHGLPAAVYQPVPSATATAAPAVATLPPAGESDLTVAGGLAFRSTRDFECSTAPDDFFVRGAPTQVDGVKVYFDVNVEYFHGPGRYVAQAQVLVRRINDDRSVYESWYATKGTATVARDRRSLVLEPLTIPAEDPASHRKPLRVAGTLVCAH